ncbi:hypothetical protein DFH09DRAFT_1067781 [Mycena vulgaris]|nr:hypothetical protein DFH09DRAFT_1067781 [Mycena vulgaris]
MCTGSICIDTSYVVLRTKAQQGTGRNNHTASNQARTIWPARNRETLSCRAIGVQLSRGNLVPPLDDRPGVFATPGSDDVLDLVGAEGEGRRGDGEVEMRGAGGGGGRRASARMSENTRQHGARRGRMLRRVMIRGVPAAGAHERVGSVKARLGSERRTGKRGGVAGRRSLREIQRKGNGDGTQGRGRKEQTKEETTTRRGVVLQTVWSSGWGLHGAGLGIKERAGWEACEDESREHTTWLTVIGIYRNQHYSRRTLATGSSEES